MFCLQTVKSKSINHYFRILSYTKDASPTYYVFACMQQQDTAGGVFVFSIALSVRKVVWKMATRPKGYGLTAELESKVWVLYLYNYIFHNDLSLSQISDKFDSTLARDAFNWISELTGDSFPSNVSQTTSDVHRVLKDGIILCKYIVLILLTFNIIIIIKIS